MEYRVRWEIDVEAESPEDAVTEAERFMRLPDARYSFDVFPASTGMREDGPMVVVDREAD